MVKKEIEKQGRTDVAYCNIDQSEAELQRLVEVGGKKQIPCLFIDGKPLYESKDIVAWLRANPQ
jgi:glutaredoxin